MILTKQNIQKIIAKSNNKIQFNNRFEFLHLNQLIWIEVDRNTKHFYRGI